MLAQLHHTKSLKSLWALLALFLLNISIDVADPLSNTSRQDLTFNEQESMIEFMLEKVLGIEDAIPESEEKDVEQHSIPKKATGIDLLYSCSESNTVNHFFPALQNSYPLTPGAALPHSMQDVTAPPPKGTI